MVKVLILYSDRSGHTESMADSIAEGAEEAKADVTVKRFSEAKTDELIDADVIIMGSPTYYGLPSGELKSFLDESVHLHGKLEGKVGGAFSSSSNIGGGNETTIMAILQAMLVHGLIIHGNIIGDHYGPVTIEKPDHKVRGQCLAYGRKLASLAKQLFEPEHMENIEDIKLQK